MKRLGITTTIPIEILLAAGRIPVDLNNLFLSDNPKELIAIAEQAGFPLNTCAWIKGIYGATLKHGIEEVICVTGGDCSNTLMLLEILQKKGVKTIPFAYPTHPDKVLMSGILRRLAAEMGTTMASAEKVRRDLLPLRLLTKEMDRMTWRENTVSGKENHLWLVSSSDYNQDPIEFRARLSSTIDDLKLRQPFPPDEIRLGLAGVPPVYAGQLYEFLEAFGGRVVFNEVQRQFSMPHHVTSLSDQYSQYTYPYSTEGRIEDISSAIGERRLDGIIHYVQSFCHRAIGDIILRSDLNIPILTVEGNTDFNLSQHLKTRLEAFLDMLRLKSITKR